jgi:uncharacterized protein
MTVRLRAHHLLCMLTYVGRGYSPAFVDNYDGIVARLSQGEPIRLAAGPDDICGPIQDATTAHCHNDSVVERDRLALDAVHSLLGDAVDLDAEFSLDPAMLTRFREAFNRGQTRAACAGCEWSGLCDHVSQAGYPSAALQVTHR